MKKISIFLIMIVASLTVNGAENYLRATLTAPDLSKHALKVLDYTQITALETTPKGRLWASVLGGGDDAEGFLTLTHSDNKGKSWSEPVVALDARAEKLAVRNGVLWLSPKGELWIFYTVFDGYYDGRGSMWAAVCKNPDDATPVWEEPQYLGVGVPTGRPVLNGQGAWLLPVALWGRDVISYDRTPFIANRWNRPRFVSPYADRYTELDSKRGAGVYISTDEGKSWRENLGAVRCREEVVAARYNNPQLFRQDDGVVRMVLRTSGTAWSFAASSTDGKSWSEPARFVAAPDQNFAVHRLADGRLLMVRNGRFDNNLYWYPNGMYAYLSEDYGATWYGGLRVATDTATINPVVAEGQDGAIYIAVHNEPEGACVNRVVTTSVTEIDAATADYKNLPKSSREVLCGGKSAARAAAEESLLKAPKKKWASKDLRLATYNIQYPVGDWSGKRVPSLIALLEEYKFDVFGVQEPYLPQIEDMMDYLSKEYDWIGSNVSGDNTDRKHHFNPIFYRRDRLELLDYDTVWLTDAIGHSGYGARSVRLFIWAKFRDKKTNKVFYHFNGHYDHRGYEAKIDASYVVLDMVKRIAKGMPAFVTADYNADEKSVPYKVLQESSYLQDTMLAVDEPVNAKYQSHASYKPVQNKTANGRHIDHIFYTPNSIKINHWELIVKSHEGYYGSDHLPIFVDCRIAN